MSHWHSLLLLSVFLVFLLGLCLGQQSRLQPGRVIRRRNAEEPSIERYSYFDVELFEAIARQQKDTNVAVSPLSVKLVLGMLMEGAKGTSQDEIRRTLRLPQDEAARRNIFRHWVQPFLDQNMNADLELASHIFLPLGGSAFPNFTRIVQKWYEGNVTNVDFTNVEEAANEINRWVEIKTHGVIPGLISPNQLGTSTSALLASAVYFKADWKKPFDSKYSYNRCFEREAIKSSDGCFVASFMRSLDKFKYAYINTLDAQAVEIPYKESRYSMIIILPKGRVEELERDLVHEQLHRVLAQMKMEELELHIPRFTMNFDTDLSAALQRLSISEVFGTNANLSGIINSRNNTLTIGNVFHTVKVQVDEQGTEAAAATGASIVPLIGAQKKTFLANKPFIFFIRDGKTKSNMFAGRVYTPDEAILKTDKRQSEASDPSNPMAQSVHNSLPSERPYEPRKPGPPNSLQSHNIGFAELSPTTEGSSGQNINSKEGLPLSIPSTKESDNRPSNTGFSHAQKTSFTFNNQDLTASNQSEYPKYIMNGRPENNRTNGYVISKGNNRYRKTTPRPTPKTTPPPMSRDPPYQVTVKDTRSVEPNFQNVMFKNNYFLDPTTPDRI